MSTEKTATFGIRLRKARRALDLTQKEFGNSTGITGGYVSDIEKKNKVPSDQLMQLIQINHKISRRWLETGEGDMFTKPVHTSVRLAWENKDKEPQPEPPTAAPADRLDELLGKTARVLQSNTPYSIALTYNVDAFHAAVESVDRERTLSAKFSALEQSFFAKIKTLENQIELLKKGTNGNNLDPAANGK